MIIIHGDRSNGRMDLAQPKEMNFTTSNLADSWEKFKKSYISYSSALELENKDEKTQIGVLLHCISARRQENFGTPQFDPAADNIKIKKYIIAKFDKEFCPKKNITYERFKLNSSSQVLGQTVEDYITELRKLAAHVNLEI